MEVQDPRSHAKGLEVSTGLKRLDVDVESYSWSEDYFDFLFEAPTPTQPDKSEENLRIFHQLELGLWELMAEQQAALTDSGRQVLTSPY